MKLGVAGLLPAWPEINLAACRRVRAAGFCGAQWFFPRPLEVEWKEVRRVQSAFAGAGLEICQVNGAYEALVNPNEALRALGVRELSALVRLGGFLKTPSVYVRPGGMNPRGHWWPHPDNHTSATFDRLVDSLKQVCRIAEGDGVTLAIEGHVLSPLDSARRVRDLLDAVASPALKFNVDPVNFIGSVADAHDTRRVLNELFDFLGTDTVVAHAKDVGLGETLVLHIDEVPLGTGNLDYALFLRRFEQACPTGYILIEHLSDEEIPLARVALLTAAKHAGIKIINTAEQAA
jgi:sugar phosphate isomerase/epimerase